MPVRQSEVDPALLHRTGTRLREAVSVASEVRRSRGTLTSLADDAGHAGLTGAVHIFVDRWNHGLACLTEDADRLATMLADSGRVYLQVESAVLAALGGRR